MTHAIFVSAAYGASALALACLLFWIVVDHRARKRELAELEKAGIRRRSDKKAEPPHER